MLRKSEDGTALGSSSQHIPSCLFALVGISSHLKGIRIEIKLLG